MMVGSYAPKATAHSYITPLDEAPSGLMGRGTYSVSSLFTDDDKKEHLKVKRQPDADWDLNSITHLLFFFQWEWTLEVKKDWASEDQ